jgi:hypothetical protein
MFKSPHINHAVAIATAAGYMVKEVSSGWSKVDQVVYMSGNLTADVRQAIEKEEPSLRYWSTNRTPHNPAEEGFTCDDYKVAMSFPKS